MNTKRELSVIGPGSLGLPGNHQLTLVGIKWCGEVTLKDLGAVMTVAYTMARAEPWVLGDALVQYVRSVQHEKPELRVHTILRQQAEASSFGQDVLYERYAVSNYFQFKERRPALHWSHHRVVWAAKHDVKHQALEWLARAEREGLSVEALRAALREEMKATQTAEPEIPALFPMELQRTESYLSGRLEEVDAMTIEDAQKRLEDMANTVEYVDRLRAKVAKSATQEAA